MLPNGSEKNGTVYQIGQMDSNNFKSVTDILVIWVSGYCIYVFHKCNLSLNLKLYKISHKSMVQEHKIQGLGSLESPISVQLTAF